MSTRDTNPVIALLAPVPVEALAALKERDDHFAANGLISGTGAYNALASDVPYSWHDDDGPEIQAALTLSRTCDAPVYVVSFNDDYMRVTRCKAGEIEEDGEDDPEALARELGLEAMLAPELPDTRDFMFVENARPEDVARALRAVPGMHLEARESAVLGWIDGKGLDLRPNIVSDAMQTRVFHALDHHESFAVLVTESGVDVGMFEVPRTDFSDGQTRIDSILGETTREGILRAMGVDDSMNPQR